MENHNMIWHYTVANRLQLIIADGMIRPATAHVPANERPIVWFSRRQDWEPTAGPALKEDGIIRKATFAEMNYLAGGMARIGVAPETAPYNWHQLKRQSGMTSGEAHRLEKGAMKDRASTGDWRGTFDPVPKEKWLAIELLHEEKWIALPASKEAIEP